MALDEEAPELTEQAPRRRRVRLRHIAAGIALVLLVAAAWLWFSRERLADNIIADQLAQMGLPATYEIVSIGPSRQVIENIVIGDPQRPDLTIERAEVTIRARWGFPGIGTVTLVRPRLYGSYRGGVLSFGSLDKVLFAPTEPEQPFELPDWNLRLVDGRGLIESDYGPIGVKADGKGNLKGGFAGILAANAPALSGFGCTAERTTLYGKVAISGERPRFTGPLRMGALACREMGLTLANAGNQLDGRLTRRSTGSRARRGCAPAHFGMDRTARWGSTARPTWRGATAV